MHPDPLETLYAYPDPADQEIVGLVAAGLAYGRVAQILASIGTALAPLGPSPRVFLRDASERSIDRLFAGFRHRFTSGAELSSLLLAVKRAVADHGSLERLFRAGLSPGDGTVLPALSRFVAALRALAPRPCPSLLSSPDDGSACKRLNLYLRWMIRRDAVDPGPWRSVPAAKLVVPLDTHLFRIGRALGLTTRRQADLKTALEITRGFAAVSPRDPVRYDFCLTRLGIRPECRGMPLAVLLDTRPGRITGAAPASRRAPSRGRRRR
ncbi:MAG: TIGR02757 family protein [Spirochaetes bacterium]|nr:TIGR02757 family protein [Spirochaetota bacterium]